MVSNRKGLRGAVIIEDRRTERFFRELLEFLGFDKRNFKFKPAPSGKGDAAAWVRAQYPPEVKILRIKRHQRLAVVAVRDGNSAGVERRVIDLDNALIESSLETRQANERIATPVPNRSIETWLIALVGDDNVDDNVDESKSLKHDFENRYPGMKERQVLRKAARAWRYKIEDWTSVPSLVDGQDQMTRLDLP